MKAQQTSPGARLTGAGYTTDGAGMTTMPVPVSPASRPSLSPNATMSSSTMSYIGTSSGSSRNPLLVKVNRLLSANLDDTGTKAALDTLGEFSLSSSPHHTTTVASGSDTLADAIKGSRNVTTSAATHKPLQRGELRKQVERNMAQGSQDFLMAFSQVNEKLSMLQTHLDEMHLCCDQVQTQLEKANSGTKYLLEHAQGLRQQRATAQNQQALVHLFLSRFTLTDQEVRALTSPDVPVGPELFAAMDKTERIRQDCRSLLSGELGDGTQAGMDIMEYSSEQLESGFNKIFKWCTFESRGFKKDVLEVSPTMRAAIYRLKSRPDLLNEVLTLLGATRSTAILNLFLDALTRGGPNGLPRPIELHAHDPIRYIGDMLAWIHQTMATEREFLESLFGIKQDGRWVGSVRVYKKRQGGSLELDDEDRLRSLLDKDLESCGRPLKMRVQQTIKSQEGSIMTYRIATLIHFYKVTMERTIGDDAHMVKVLGEITDIAYAAFFETLTAHGKTLLRFIQPPAAALSPPSQLRDTLSTLREIMAVYSSSLLDDANLVSFEQRETEFKSVLDASLDPVLEMCDRMSQLRPTEWERCIFKINCIETCLTALDGFGFTATRVKQLEDEEAVYVETLTVEHFGHLLKDSGLEPIVEALKTKDADTPLSHLPTASSTILSQSLAKFSTFLSTVDTLSSPRLSLLPPRFAASIHLAALDRISKSYNEVFDAVMNDKNRYEAKSTMLKTSKQDVSTLLGF
ncbi:Golgi transport complex subunit 6 [Microbotryomycetes sp. JL221]|nr:Golgi transport complex subunit 6 [Microbotryomycetes sp. JL221]